MKIFKTILILALIIPLSANAIVGRGWSADTSASTNIYPTTISGTTPSITVPFIIASSTTTSSYFASNVGIGSSTPMYQLTLDGQNPIIGLHDTGEDTTFAMENIAGLGTLAYKNPFATSSGVFAETDGLTYLSQSAPSNGYFDVLTNNTTRVRILGNGKVGVSSSTPAYTLGIVGTVGINGLSSATNKFAVCLDNATKEIVQAGNTTCITSSEFLKHDITPITSAQATAILKLEPIQYAENEDGSQHYGFIAEKTAQIDPLLVEYAQQDTTIADHIFKKGDPISVDYIRGWALLTKFVQEQQIEIDSLGNSLPVNRKRIEDNWQWVVIGLLGMGLIYQQVQIRKLK